MPGMFVNSTPPVSSLIQNSEMADPAATLVNAALTSSLLMPALTAAATKWAASMACATMCFETASSAAGALFAVNTPLNTRHRPRAATAFKVRFMVLSFRRMPSFGLPYVSPSHGS